MIFWVLTKTFSPAKGGTNKPPSPREGDHEVVEGVFPHKLKCENIHCVTQISKGIINHFANRRMNNYPYYQKVNNTRIL